jgi:hypothetical protein
MESLMSDTQRNESQLSLFERHVKHALRYLDDPERLTRESPLAGAYMLSRALGELAQPAEPRSRGEALVAVIRAAAARLWRGPLPSTREAMLAAIAEARRDPNDPHYAYVVLELRCFHDFITPRRMAEIWEDSDLLPGSKSQHYRDFDAAVRRLAELLLESMRPAYHHERPRAPVALFGYDEQLAMLAEGLRAGRSVVLSGPGGAGKTSLAARALELLGPRPVFWYTLRPGFNDGVSSLLFALGAFLHEHGASGLWHYLAGVGDEPSNLALAAGLARQDLAALGTPGAVICFDEIEHLAVAELALRSTAHTRLLDMIEALRGAAALLLIGQRPLLSGDRYVELGGLNEADSAQLCAAAGHRLRPAELARLHAATGGNPRLLLLLTLRDDDQAAAATEPEIVARSLLPAFQRLWRRLSDDERRLLQQLAVYPYRAPADIFDSALLWQLDRQRLIETDGAGGVSLLPALAPLVHNQLSAEQRFRLHAQAALVRLERGEVTAAAYHFAQGGDENRAVQVWFPQRRQALAHGEADVARTIFGAMALQRLAKSERKALMLIRTELQQLAGQSAAGLRELDQVDWTEQSEAHAQLWRLRGELQAALGYPDQALNSYGEGLQLIVRLLGQQAALHQRRGVLRQHRRDLSGSWQEIRRAEFDLELLRGTLLEEEGSYDQALATYGRARALAEQLSDDVLLAQVERQLAAVYGRREQLAEAVAHATRAIAIYERIGDRLNLEKMRSNLAAIYVQTRQFSEALSVGGPTYDFFVAMGNPYFAAVTAANLAEAAYGLGDLDGARRYAEAVIALNDRFAAPYALFTLGQVALSRRQPTAAAASFSEAMQRAQRNDDPYMVAYAQRALGEALLSSDKRTNAEQHLKHALEAFRYLEIPSEIAATEQLLEKV